MAKTLVNNHDLIGRKSAGKKDHYQILCKALDTDTLDGWDYKLYSDSNGSHCICGKKIKYRFQIGKGNKKAFVGSECIGYFSRDLQEKILQVKSNKKYPLTKSEKQLAEKIEAEKLEIEKAEFARLTDLLGWYPSFTDRCRSGKAKSSKEFYYCNQHLRLQIKHEGKQSEETK